MLRRLMFHPRLRAVRIAAPAIAGVVMCGPFIAAPTCFAQALEDRLDEEQYLRGLQELQLPEVINHYLQTHTGAQGVDAELRAIVRMQTELDAGAGASAEERKARVEALLSARERLIATHAQDARRALWLADQASDILTKVFASDALGVTALFGFPNAEQQQRATQMADRMHRLAGEAEQAIEVAIRAIETSPGYARDTAAQKRRREYAEVDRDRRIPFLRGVAAVHKALIVARNDPAEQRSLLAEANRTLAPLAGRLTGTAFLQLQLHHGLALAGLGEFDEAEARFASVAKDPAATELEIFSARMGGVLNRKTRGGASAALEALDSIEPKYLERTSLLFRMILIDQRFLLRRDIALDAAPARRAALLAQAFASYTALLKQDDRASSLPREVLRELVFERLVNASRSLDGASGMGEGADLPPLVMIALAEGRSRDPQQRAEAVMTLEWLLANAALEGSDRASALFVLGRALFETQQPLLAAERFLELARDFPSDAQSERAIELAATLAWDEYRAHPADERAATTLKQALDLLLSKYANLQTIDHWRHVAGVVALDRGEIDAARTAFMRVAPDAPEYADAQFMLVQTARRRVAASAGESDRALHQEVRDAVARVAPVIERAITSATVNERKEWLHFASSMLKIYDAEAMLALGEAQKAIDALAGMETRAGATGEEIGEAMRVRINAYQQLKRPQDALRDLDRFVEAAPAQAGAALPSLLSSLQADVQALLDAEHADQARDLAQRTLLPAARALQTWLESEHAPNADSAAALRARVADAHRLAGECERALAIYDQALAAQSNDADLILGKAECLFELGGDQRWADAMMLYRRLAASGEASGRDAYWLAQLRMLQVLDRTGRGTQQILPRIERLRQSDKDFGGERYRRGFEALRAKYTGSPAARPST